MTVGAWLRARWIFVWLTLAGGCAAGVNDIGESEQPYDDELPAKSLAIDNGMRVINGLSSSNGLCSVNGLSAQNGLNVRNGLISINGLATKNGLHTVSGRFVNCAGSKSCTGAPDGMLDAKRGLLKDETGVNLASYLIRCALPADKTIAVKRWDGQLVSFNGEAGFAPEWETGQCGSDCQEKVSACLLALVNGSGKHVRIMMSAAWASGALRQVPNSSWLQEAVFFGNVFSDPPRAYVAIHRDWARALKGLKGNDVIPIPRMCSGVPGIEAADYYSQYKRCPIKIVGEAGDVIGDAIKRPLAYANYDLCFMTDRAGAQALYCRDAWTSNVDHVDPSTWYFPLTTFVSSPVW